MSSSWKRDLLLLTVPSLLVVLVVLELAFRFVIPAVEVPHRYVDPDHGIMHYVPDREGLYTAGNLAQQRAPWRINNAGWNSPIHYRPREARTRPLIAIIGDSYVEAFQVPPQESFVGRLRATVGDQYDVYGFGMSGAPLSEYLQLSRYVDREFDPDVVVFSLVHNDLHESLREVVDRPYFTQLRVEGDSFAEEPPTIREVKGRRYLGKSALARYLLYNVRANRVLHRARSALAQREPEHNANVDVRTVDERRATVERATEFLMRRIGQEHPDTPVLVMMDAPRADLYAGALSTSSVAWMNELVREAAEENGLEFLDLRPVFEEEYHRTGRRFETPYDAHWSEFGHAVVAKALRSRLREMRLLDR